MNGQRESFQLMAKPSGSVCNLDCQYCFYLEKEHLYPDRKSHWKMNGTTLENYIKQTIDSQLNDVIDFIWQGGEPTLLGLDFYREAVRLQEVYRGKKSINNYFQTNGIDLTDEWCQFFKQQHFLIGISIDGDRISHDTYRTSRSGKGSFDEVMTAINRLKRFKVEFNTLTVVNAENVKRPLDVYRFLKRIGSQYMQFIPLVERIANQPDANGLTLIGPDFSGQNRVADWSVPAKEYGVFLNRIFDEWLQRDFGRVFVMNFEQTLTKLLGGVSGCVINETCGRNLIVEANGDVYSCDHFVYPEHKLGNINHDNMVDMVRCTQNSQFGQRKKNEMSVECQHCVVKSACNGGCPKHRFEFSSDGKRNKNYFCSSYFTHLSYAMPKMYRILDGLRSGKSNKQIVRAVLLEND